MRMLRSSAVQGRVGWGVAHITVQYCTVQWCSV